MKNAIAIILLFVVLVMTFGVSGVALADRSLLVDHTTSFASISDAAINDDRTISGETIDGDVEADGDVVVTDGSRVKGDVEAGRNATIIDSRVDGDVEADGDITVEGSGVDGDVEADGDLEATDGSRIRGDVEAEADATIIDSRIDGDFDTEGSARFSASIVNEDIDAEGTVELADGSRIKGDVDAGGDVVISKYSRVDGEIDADGDVIYEDREAAPELSDLNIAGQGAEATITEGDDEDVSVVVENVGDADGSFEVTVAVGDWTDTQSTGTIASGDSDTVSFGGVTGDLAPAEYDVTASTGEETVTGNLTVLADQEPAFFEVGLTDTNSAVTAGEPLTVDVTMTNTGEEEVTQTVELDVETLGTDSESVTLGGGVSTTERFVIGTGIDDAGEYTVTVRTDDDSDSAQVTVEQARAESDLSELDIAGQGSAATITEEDDEDVSVTVENVGDAPGSFDVILVIGDTLGMTENTGELAAGGTVTITFPDLTAGLVADGYTVDVSTANDTVTGTLEVRAQELEDDREDDEREDDREDEGQAGDDEDREDEQESDGDDDERERTFEITLATLSNTEISAGENLEIGLQVENVAAVDGRFDPDLLVNGETVDSKSVTIEAGGTDTIAFSYQFDEPGEYEIAVGDRPLATVTVTHAEDDESEMERSGDDVTAIEIVQATVPAHWVRDGYETSMRVTVENTANRTANRTFTVTIDDQPVATETVTLQPHERDEVIIEFEAFAGSVAVDDVEAGLIDTSETYAEVDRVEEDTDEVAGFEFMVGIAAFLVIVGTLARVAVLKL